MELSLSTFLFVTLVQFLSFFIKGIAGFGDPIISSPLLAFSMETRVISPVTLLISAPSNAYIAWKDRREYSVKQALPIVALIILGTIPGTMLLKYGTSWVLKALLGALIIGIGVEMITRNRSKPIRGSNLSLAAVSFASGLTEGLFGIGIFIVAYLERTSDNHGSFRGSLCFIFLLCNISRIVLYSVTGIITAEVLMLALASVPGMVLGLWAGQKLDKRLSEATVKKIVIILFLLGGISILIKALVTRS